MVNLKAFVHLSALAAFAERDEIKEKLYKSHIEYEDFLSLLKLDKALPMDEYDKKRIVGNKLTTYGLTKAAAENIFIREKISVPVVIFRFPLSSPCVKEPMPGYTSGGLYGPNGIFLLPVLGIYLASYWEGDINFDYAPADLVVNALLATIQHSYNKFSKNKHERTETSPFVYNFSTKYHKNTMPFHNVALYCKKEFCSWHRFYSNKLRFMIYTVEFGYIPAIIIDSFGALFGEKFGYYPMYKQLVESNFKLARVSSISSEVVINNVQNCWENLNNVDKRLFSFDLNEVVWDEYLHAITNSFREYLRIVLEKNKKIRMAAYWTPRIRVAFKVLQLILVTFVVYYFYH